MIVEYQVQVALALGARPADEAIAVGQRPSAGAKAQAAQQLGVLVEEVAQLGAGHRVVGQVVMLPHHLAVKQPLKGGAN